MENISIKVKLIGLVSVLIAMMISIGAFGMISTHDIIAHLKDDAHKEQDLAHTLELAERTEIEFKSQIQYWQNILIRGNEISEYEKYTELFSKQSDIVKKDLEKLAAKYKKLNMDTSEIKHVSVLHEAMNKQFYDALKQFNKNDPETGKYVDSLVGDADRPVIKAFDEMVHHLSEEIDNVVKASEAYAAEVETRTRNIDIAMIAGGSLLGFIMGMFLIRSIIKPINQIVHVTERLAEGDMTVSIKAAGKNEIGKLQHALAVMTDKLRNVIKEVHKSANNVSVSADEISGGNLDLSSRTEEQAASLEETSSSMEQVTEKVQENSKSAVRAVELADSATDKAGQGLEVAQAAVNAINEIKSSSEQVAEIISVIDEIAFQTNLLALNASIEAERAGEQGRGFSVVANEVQKLAQRSADAANEIKGLIKDSSQKVQEGTDLVMRSSQALEGIVQTSKETNEVIQNISAASQEQTEALLQVKTAIAQLDETTQQNAALVEETSAASTSMSDQAKTLAELVSFFKFGEQATVAKAGNNKNAHSPQKADANEGPRQYAYSAAGNTALKPGSGGGQEWEEF